MKNDRRERMKKQVRRRLAIESAHVLDSLRTASGNGSTEMEYFYRLMEAEYGNVESGNGAAAKNVKRIGTQCIQVPDELILALDARPVRLCSGSQAYDQAGTEFLPAKSCSLVRATYGRLQVEELQDDFDLIVIPATCDQKKKSGEMLENTGYTTHILDLPSIRDSDAARSYWYESILKLAARLENITGNRLSARKLKGALALTNRARREYRRLHQLRGHLPPVISGSDVFVITNAYSFDRIERWSEALQALNDELERRIEANQFVADKQAPRLLITGSPSIFPNLKVPLLIEQLGGVIVADEICSSSRLLYDAPSFDEPRLYDLLPAIADRALKPCTCPCLVPNRERHDRILELMRNFAVDGVLYQSFSGCQLYEMEARMLGETLSEHEMGMLYIETDYSPEDIGQLSTRIEAFIESIRIRKRNGKSMEAKP